MVAHAQDLADAKAQGLTVSGCYDVVMADVIWTPEFAQAGYIAELDQRDFDTTAYLPRPLNSAMVDGKLWAIPMRTDAAFLYYRKDLLAAHHRNAPTTWAELVEQARTIAPAHGIDGYVSQFSRYEGVDGSAFGRPRPAIHAGLRMADTIGLWVRQSRTARSLRTCDVSSFLATTHSRIGSRTNLSTGTVAA
jgi:spermidine/putrescine-binding protein